MNKTKKETALPKIAVDKLFTGVIPIVLAENTRTASLIPKPEGVKLINKDKIPIELNNKASWKEI